MDDLVARARRGDRTALEELLASVAPSVHRFARRMCKNAHDAEDVLQDTLIDVARHIDRFEGRSSLSSWIFTVARSACARKRRGLKHRPAAGDHALADEADTAPDPELSAEHRERVADLLRALDALSDEHREVILLRDAEGLSAPEAASVLGLSVDALKSRLHRARAALRERLRPTLEQAPSPSLAGCPDVLLSWSRKLEGDLNQADCAAMERHVASCAACSAVCDDLKRALVACRNVAGGEVPRNLREAVQAALRVATQRAAP